MKIAAVIGSYRKGNTYKTIRRIEELMKSMGDVEFTYIFLAEKQLADCRGCYTCILQGEEKCPLKDDLHDIEAKLKESDGTIFASPNYACGVTALMKKFIERIAYIGHRPCFFGRYMATVATSGGPIGLKPTLSNLAYFAGGGFMHVAALGLMMPPTLQSAATLKAHERKIHAFAEKLYTAIQENKKRSPTLGSVVQFASFRGIYRKNPALGEAKFPADIAYWRKKGWLDKKTRYFTDARPGVIKGAIGWLLEKVIGIASKGMRAEAAKGGGEE